MIYYVKIEPGHEKRYAIDATKLNKIRLKPIVTIERMD
jgi:dTDP-D-glucose 4,6-dehydratase